jgi:MarR family transcriptional regulator, organic hydroperoxide resistance regulator
MTVLWKTDGIPVKNIAQQLHLDSPSITPLLKHLESDGFVSRERSTSYECIVNIFLTDAGRVIQARVADMQKGVPAKPVCQKQSL